jgi:type II secretory pathway component GspD/PulD (secretin)
MAVAAVRLSAAVAQPSLPAEPTPAVAPPAAAPKATKARAALNAAVASQRRGDYEQAAALLRDAVESQASLSPTEQQELIGLFQANTQALDGRRLGAEALARAEKAAKENRPGEAAEALKKAAANEQYLTAADRLKFQALNPTVKSVGSLGGPRAVELVAAGRAALAKGDLDDADKMGKQADALNEPFLKDVDTPKKLLGDVAKARTDANVLLKASRIAFNQKDYVKAADYARQSERASSTWGLVLIGDTPSKVLADVEKAKAAEAAAKAPPKPDAVKPAPDATVKGPPKPEAAKPTADAKPTVAAKPEAVKPTAEAKPTVAAKPPAAEAKPPAGPSNTDKARDLLVQARKAMTAGDLVASRKLIDQARALKPDLQWFEDNPDKLQAEVARAEARQQPAAPTAAVAKKDEPPTDAKAKAVALLQEARTQLGQNKIDDAVATCGKARAMTTVQWGLFDDSPAKVQQDIDKTRSRLDQEDSVKVLAEGRKLLEQGDVEGAERAAFKAQKLHGAYGYWEFGDRPSKLQADVESAKVAKRKVKPADDVAAKDKTPPASIPATSQDAQARKLLADARVALKAGDVAKAQQLTEQVQRMNVTLNKPGDDTPDALRRDIAAAAKTPGAPTGPAAVVVEKTAPPAVPSADPTKARAAALVAEARQLQRDTQLLAARQKALEAQQLHVVFTLADPDSPEAVLSSLAASARRRIGLSLSDADQTAAVGAGDAVARLSAAEAKLLEARELAVGFGQDAQPVEAKLSAVRLARTAALQPAVAAKGPPDKPAGPPVPVASGAGPVTPAKYDPAAPPASMTPAQEGLALLDQARLALKAGNTPVARTLTEKVWTGNYGVQKEAEVMLRSIDAEDFGQQQRRDCKTFDAAVRAYQKRDFATASSYLDAIDARRLTPERQAKLKELRMTPEMQPGHGGPVQLVSVGPNEVGVRKPEGTPVPDQPAHMPLPGDDLPTPGKARASDSGLLKTAEAMRSVKFQQLRRDGLDAISLATEKAKAGNTDAAIDVLRDYLAKLPDDQLDPAHIALLRKPIESRLQRLDIMKLQDTMEKQSKGNATEVANLRGAHDKAEHKKQELVSEALKQSNGAYKDGKYLEAMRFAEKAHELDPDNVQATAAMGLARMSLNLSQSDKIKDEKNRFVGEAIRDMGREGPSVNIDDPIAYNKEHWKIAGGRKGNDIESPYHNQKEREIERKLTTPVTLNWNNAPLRQVIEDLRAWEGLTIYVDDKALADLNISLDHPIDVKFEQISLKAALKLLLKSPGLTYIIQDECLQITTERAAKGKQKRHFYPVGDLVIPIQSFGAADFPSQLAQPNTQPSYTPSPILPRGGISGGTPTGTPNGASPGTTSAGSPGQFASDGASGQSTEWNKKSAKDTQEKQLIDLITSSIDPNSWQARGGGGTIDYTPITMTLTVNQTQDIQEQIQDLLESLRRLQDQEVAIEVRLISIEDDFFERIGVDFALNIKTDQQTTKIEPQLTSGVFKPAPFINDLGNAGGIITGLAPGGALTSNLDIPIRQSSFINTVPTFGGYTGGGLSLGLAFLSDIQVFLFLEASQGNTRFNVMQAPKLSLFNGQTAFLTVNDQQSFVTGVNVQTLGNGNPIFIPQIQPIQTGGVNVTLQAVISADRRFVRLTPTLNLSNVVPGPVAVVPVVVPIFPTAADQPNTIVFTQLIQTPVVSSVSVGTTVSVPDGGTVLMGGLKRLSEARSEYGPPILSKIPYIDRLFKNVGYGRNAESLLLMVTPRIIIQEEEETRQTGFDRTVQQAGPGG